MISDLASRKVPFVDGQNVEPLSISETSLSFMVRLEKLMILIVPALAFCVPRFLTPQ